MRKLLYQAWTQAGKFSLTKAELMKLPDNQEIKVFLAANDVFIPEQKVDDLAMKYEKIKVEKTLVKHNTLAQFDFIEQV